MLIGYIKIFYVKIGYIVSITIIDTINIFRETPSITKVNN